MPDRVPLNEFATKHGIHPWYTRREVNAGRLSLAHWNEDRPERALDVYGQAQFYWVYRQDAQFKRCPACPHGVQEEEPAPVQRSLFDQG